MLLKKILSSIAYFLAVLLLIATAENKKSTTKKRKIKGAHKGPYYEFIQPRLKANGDSKEVEGKKPIDEDNTIRQLIFPGTKWCGQGNTATHYGDLGVYQTTDVCCRNHDYCPDYIAAGQTKYGLTNRAPYTKVHCDCDSEFKTCLMDDKSDVSDDVGHLYFDHFGSECFKMEHPIKSCIQYSKTLPKRCLVYELDETQEKQWQFFDNPYYS